MKKQFIISFFSLFFIYSKVMNAQYGHIERMMRILSNVPNAVSGHYFKGRYYTIVPNLPKNQKGEYVFRNCKDIRGDSAYWYLFRQGFVFGTQPIVITDTSISFPNQEKSKAFDIHVLFPQSPYYHFVCPTLLVPIVNLSNKKILVFMRCHGNCLVAAMSEVIPSNTSRCIELEYKYADPFIKRRAMIFHDSPNGLAMFPIHIHTNIIFHDIDVIPKLPKRVFKNLYLQRILRRTQHKMIFYLQAFGLPTKFKPLQYLKT